MKYGLRLLKKKGKKRQIWVQSVYYDILINQTNDKNYYVSDEWRIFLFGAKYNLG